jgi:hypothetical protein
MKKTIFFLLTICFIIISAVFSSGRAFAQSQFQLTIGGTGDDYGNSVIQTTDGGYALVGETNSYGAGYYDLYVLKLNPNETLQWTKTVGGPSDEDFYKVVQTTDGGYAAIGITYSFGAGSWDYYIVKLSANGSLQWNKTIGGAGDDESISFVQTTDGGYAIAGAMDSFGAGDFDACIVKLDAAGNLQWSKTIGGTGSDVVFSIIQTSDGGYAGAGWTNSFGAGGIDMYIVKLDAVGNLQWSKTVGGTDFDYAYSIIQTTDGGYAVAGKTVSYGAGGYDVYVVKLSGSGTLQWTRTAGGTSDDGAGLRNSLIQTTDGGYAICGSTESFGAGAVDMYIVKLDGSGILQWSKTVGGTDFDYAYSIIQTTDGGFDIIGRTASFGAGGIDLYFVKLDVNGNTCGNFTSPSSSSGTGGILGSPNSIVTSPVPTIMSPNPSISSGGTLAVICIPTGIQSISNGTPDSYKLQQNYPNPFNPSTKISYSLPKAGNVNLVIFDALGREVSTLVNEEVSPGSYEVTWDASNYPSGVYFYKLSAGDYTKTRKMILIK